MNLRAIIATMFLFFSLHTYAADNLKPNVTPNVTAKEKLQLRELAQYIVDVWHHHHGPHISVTENNGNFFELWRSENAAMANHHYNSNKLIYTLMHYDMNADNELKIESSYANYEGLKFTLLPSSEHEFSRGEKKDSVIFEAIFNDVCFQRMSDIGPSVPIPRRYAYNSPTVSDILVKYHDLCLSAEYRYSMAKLEDNIFALKISLSSIDDYWHTTFHDRKIAYFKIRIE